MNFDELARRVSALFNDLAVQPLAHFFLGLSKDDRTVLYVLLAAAVAFGLLMGRRRTFDARHASAFQNSSEASVSRVLLSKFGPPDYHLMNHVTIRMDDDNTLTIESGTTTLTAADEVHLDTAAVKLCGGSDKAVLESKLRAWLKSAVVNTAFGPSSPLTPPLIPTTIASAKVTLD